MSISLGSETLTVESIRRTWRTTLESQLGQPYTLTSHRELVKKAGDIVLAKNQNAGTVQRALPAVAAETVTLHDGTVLSAAQIAEGLAAFVEKWEAADLVPKVPAAA